MIEYQTIKKIISQNRVALILGAGYILVFGLGFGVGKYDQAWQKHITRLQANYNTRAASSTKVNEALFADEPAVFAETVAGTTTPCVIKGNISTNGKKIYHVPGGSFYNRVNPEQCFLTEAEARAAGFVKSSR